MKVILNKEPEKDIVLDEAKKVVEKAQMKAVLGVANFNFHYSSDINGSSLIDRVKELTEGTVICAYRGHDTNNRTIRFCIVEVK